MRIQTYLVALAATAFIPATASADVITDFNSLAVATQIKLAVGPNPAARGLAIIHLAAHDAVVAVTHTSAPYLEGLSASKNASADAAAATALRDTLIALYPAETATIELTYQNALAAITDGAAKTNGINLGHDAATAILEARANDGSGATSTFPGEDTLGKWRPTPRADTSLAPLAFAQPWWAQVTPFGLTSPNQFRPEPPPALNSAAYAAAYAEVKSLGSKTGSTRTAEQTKIATFWAQPTQIPFNAIARTLSTQKGLSVDENARLFALLNLALADSRVAVWDSKVTYGFWRPITAINTVDDGVAATTSDAAWVPFLETPNHSSYASGHSTTGNAGATTLKLFFGTDALSFTVASTTAVDQTRAFTSLSAAAQENADSRVYGGIHYSFDNNAGLALGAKIAEYVAAHHLTLIEAPVVDGTGGVGGSGPEVDGTGGHSPTDSLGGSSSASTGGTVGGDPIVDGEPSGCSVGNAAGASARGWVGGLLPVFVLLALRRRRRHSAN